MSFPPYDRVLHYECWRRTQGHIPASPAAPAAPAEGRTPRRYLVIVRRDSPALLAEVRQDFDPLRTLVDVVEDRRVGERRRGAPFTGEERRRGDRRNRPPGTWRDLGFLLTAYPSE